MIISFFCKKCDVDLDEDASINENRYGKWFEGRCPKCKSKIIRYITDRDKDPYYQLSKNVIINRERYRKDLIQPGEEGFQTYYKKQYDDIEKTKELYCQQNIKDRKSRDEFFEKYKLTHKNLAKKVIDLEEKLSNA